MAKDEESATTSEVSGSVRRTDAASPVSINSVREGIIAATFGDQPISDFAREKGDNRRDSILAGLRESEVPIGAVNTPAVAEAVTRWEDTVRGIADAADQAPRDGHLSNEERQNAEQTIRDVESITPISRGSVLGRAPAGRFGELKSEEIAADLLANTANQHFYSAQDNGVENFVNKDKINDIVDTELGGIRDVADAVARTGGKPEVLEREPRLGDDKSEIDVATEAYGRNHDAYQENITENWNGYKANELKETIDKLREKTELRDTKDKPFDGTKSNAPHIAEVTDVEISPR